LARLASGEVEIDIDPDLRMLARFALDEALAALHEDGTSWRPIVAGALAGRTPRRGGEIASPPELAFLLGCVVAQRAALCGRGLPGDLAIVVVPAVLGAAAVMKTPSEQQAVDAVAIGMEVTARVALGLGLGHYRRGWDVTSTAGRVGAAIAAGRLLGGDEAALQDAAGIAATEAAGLRRAAVSEVGVVQRAKASWDALEAALLARNGFTSAAASLEGRRGLGQLTGDGFTSKGMLRGLGQRWLAAERAAFAVMGRDAPAYRAGLVGGATGSAEIEIGWKLGHTEERHDALVWSVAAGLHDSGGLSPEVSGTEEVSLRRTSSLPAGAVALFDGSKTPLIFASEIRVQEAGTFLDRDGLEPGATNGWEALALLATMWE
jgi:hypothetical protein